MASDDEAQAVFRPGEVVPYPAVWLDRYIKARVRYRYGRGPLKTMNAGWKAILRRIDGFSTMDLQAEEQEDVQDEEQQDLQDEEQQELQADEQEDVQDVSV
ncbi:MAG: hypothetical protein Q9180_009191 [Flavoplaca navasiana]